MRKSFLLIVIMVFYIFAGCVPDIKNNTYLSKEFDAIAICENSEIGTEAVDGWGADEKGIISKTEIIMLEKGFYAVSAVILHNGDYNAMEYGLLKIKLVCEGQSVSEKTFTNVVFQNTMQYYTLICYIETPAADAYNIEIETLTDDYIRVKSLAINSISQSRAAGLTESIGTINSSDIKIDYLISVIAVLFTVMAACVSLIFFSFNLRKFLRRGK